MTPFFVDVSSMRTNTAKARGLHGGNTVTLFSDDLDITLYADIVFFASLSGTDKIRQKLHGSNLFSAETHDHVVITVDNILDQDQEIGYLYCITISTISPTPRALQRISMSWSAMAMLFRTAAFWCASLAQFVLLAPKETKTWATLVSQWVRPQSGLGITKMPRQYMALIKPYQRFWSKQLDISLMLQCPTWLRRPSRMLRRTKVWW